MLWCVAAVASVCDIDMSPSRNRPAEARGAAKTSVNDHDSRGLACTDGMRMSGSRRRAASIV